MFGNFCRGHHASHMRRYPHYSESPNILFICYAGQNLYRVEFQPDCIRECPKHLIMRKKGEEQIVDYYILDKQIAIVLLQKRICVIDIEN